MEMVSQRSWALFKDQAAGSVHNTSDSSVLLPTEPTVLSDVLSHLTVPADCIFNCTSLPEQLGAVQPMMFGDISAF